MKSLICFLAFAVATPFECLCQLRPLSPQQRLASLEFAEKIGTNPVIFYDALAASLDASDQINNRDLISMTPLDWNAPDHQFNKSLMINVGFTANLKAFVARYQEFTIGGEPTKKEEFPECVALGDGGACS